jgi:hypothetical protein
LRPAATPSVVFQWPIDSNNGLPTLPIAHRGHDLAAIVTLAGAVDPLAMHPRLAGMTRLSWKFRMARAITSQRTSLEPENSEKTYAIMVMLLLHYMILLLLIVAFLILFCFFSPAECVLVFSSSQRGSASSAALGSCTHTLIYLFT